MLKETAVFGMFFEKVRYLPYFHEKSAKNTYFFKQFMPFFDAVVANFFSETYTAYRGESVVSLYIVKRSYTCTILGQKIQDLREY